ncbi:DUF6702 family protein [Mesohalobacter halotolerans]|uniref:Peptidase E n=1 Tax=Mesohalobacter halotolerans TaxID=1883405 RepID=A0A4U5TND5_9FLAO|nr:DUF6702 family protein [Mesohalobacter halotolerans]MBS3737600.1 hypothetical protein [Psychroflexus sp.]TKS55430.1 hypothetical protein FCN74_11745 [Mesohalobacter halotolerans]
MTKLLCICTIAFAQFFSILNHEYYVGLTEVKFNPDKERLEIISRLFYDDFENVLKARYGKDLKLRPVKQSKDIEAYIKLYFDKKLRFKTGDQTHKLSYLGYEFEDDRIHIYFKINHIKNFNTLNIQNLLLTDVIEDQKNIVHCFKLNQKESVLLTRDKSEAVLKFN